MVKSRHCKPWIQITSSLNSFLKRQQVQMILLMLRQLVFASNFVFTWSSLLLAFVLALVLALALLVKTRLKKASRVTW